MVTPVGAQPRNSNRLGVVALWVAVIAAVGSIVVSAVNGTQIVGIQVDSLDGVTEDQQSLLATQFGLMGTQLAWALLGLWGLIQGIFAVATDRGRGAGIGAVVVAVLFPIISFAVFLGLALTKAPLG